MKNYWKLLLTGATSLLPLTGMGAVVILDTAGTWDGTQTGVTHTGINLQQDFTVTFWMKTTNASDHGLLQVLGNNDSLDRIHLRTDEAGTSTGNFIGRVDSSPEQVNLRIIVSNDDYYDYGASPKLPISQIPTLTDNNWHQVTYQFDWDADASAAKSFLFVNGATVADSGTTLDSFTNATGTLTVLTGNGDGYIGDFSNTGFYAELVSPADIATMYSMGTGTIAVPEPSICAALAGLLALSLVAWRRRR